jgi:membrane-associated protein
MPVGGVHVDASVLGSISPQHLLRVMSEAALPLILFAETGLLLGFFLPGDSLLFVAGYATVAGNNLHLHLSLPVVLVLAPLGAVVGAQVGYEIGRRAGPRLFSRPQSRLFRAEYVDRTADVFNEFGARRAVVVARFIPIVRTFLNPMAGTVRMPVRDFTVWNIVGGVLWTVGLVLLGHVLGGVGPIRGHIELLVLLVVVLSIAPLLVEIARRHLRARRAS